MKKLTYKLGAACLLLGSILSANAWHLSGFVYCDANGDRRISSGDIGVQGVLVVVTNSSGTYSNAGWSGNDGSYTVQLSDLSDSYTAFIRSDTLPGGTTGVSPALTTFATTDLNRVITRDF